LAEVITLSVKSLNHLIIKIKALALDPATNIYLVAAVVELCVFSMQKTRGKCKVAVLTLLLMQKLPNT
jgi:hypothetical protein